MSTVGRLKTVVVELEDLKLESLDSLEKVSEAIELLKEAVASET